MKRFTPLAVLAAVAASLLLPARAAAPGAALLLISIDGMRPDYVTEAAAHGLKIPHLLDLLRSGAHASGVRGVLPTVTYPSHTTILTGVWPARHGIYLNTTFDPLNRNLDGWYWYSQDIRVPTLWEAAARSGLSVGSVSWPVSVAPKGVRYLIPEVWRAQNAEDLKLIRALSTPGLLDEFQPALGPYTSIVTLDGDRIRTRYSAAILRNKRPDFMTVHLAALDHAEHGSGPFSPEANATLEAIDGMIGELEDAMRAVHPNAAIAVVSDHGFTRTDHRVRLMLPFMQAGLITIDPKTANWPEPRVLSWKAEPWIDGGSAAIMLADPNDDATRQQVADLLHRLASDPANGIAAVLDKPAIAALGGNPGAAFWLDMQSNFRNDRGFEPPFVSEVPTSGSHGYSPEHPELRASFFIAGPGIHSGRDLGLIDMRSEAPTFAKYLGIPFPSAELPPLPIE